MIRQKVYQLIKDIFRCVGIDIEYYYPRAFIRFLHEYYRGGKELVGAEVGVYSGKNALDIFKYLLIKKLYLVDSYKEYVKYSDEYLAISQKELDDAKIEAYQRLSQFKDKTVWINDFSDIAYKKIPEKLDFIYIDGNHGYEFVKKDIENYWPLLKEGGGSCRT